MRMVTVTGKKVMWLMIALVLSACSTVDNKTPDELVRQGIQRNLLRDNKFNFNGQVRLLVDQDEVKTVSDKVADQTSDKKTKAGDTAFSSKSVRKTHEAEMSAKKNKESDQADDESSEGCGVCGKRSNKILNHFAHHVSVPFSGAIDIPHGKFELIPEMRYEASNILFSVKMPMQLDVEKKMLIMDARAIMPFAKIIGGMFGQLDKTLDKPYIAKEFSEQVNKLQLKELVHAIPKAIDDGYASYDKKNFVRLSMDEAGRKIGAYYRIQLNSSDAQDRMMMTAVLDSLSKQLKESEEHETSLYNQAEQSKNYAALQKLLAETRDKILNNKASGIGYANRAMDFYLDRRGRILAIHDIPSGLIKYSIVREPINASFWIQFDYTSHPKFTVNPNPANIFYYHSK